MAKRVVVVVFATIEMGEDVVVVVVEKPVAEVKEPAAVRTVMAGGTLREYDLGSHSCNTFQP